MDVRLPKIGDSPEGVVVSILVKPGDTVEAGQTILELENEKAIAPIPAPAAGKVGEIRVKEGQKISVGTVVMTLEAAASTPPAAATPPASAAAAAPARPGPAPVRATPGADAGADDEDSDPLPDAAEEGPVPPASPYIRKVARDLGLKLSRIRPTGSW